MNFLKATIFLFGLLPSSNSLAFEVNDSISYQYFDKYILDGEYHIKGIGVLDESKAKRIYCYRFKYSNNQLKEVAFIKGKNYYDFSDDNVSKIKIEYRGKNKIEYTYFDAVGRRTKYDNVSRKVIEYSEGFINSYNYDSERNLVEDGDGIFQYSYLLDEDGLIESKIGKDKKYKNVLNNSGVYKTNYSYDEYGNIARKSYLNIDGSLYYNKIDGYAEKYLSYDSSRNEIEVRYYNANKNPTINSTCNCFTIKKSYNKNGRLIEINYLDTNYHLTFDADYDAATIRYEENADYQVISHTYLDTADQLTPRKGFGFARVVIDHDSKGREIKKTYYGKSGHQINIKHGYASEIFEYDDSVKKEVYYRTDKDKLIIPYEAGVRYSKIVYLYNSANLLEEVNYLDEYNQSCSYDESGLYTIKYQYNANDFLQSITYLDRNGNLSEDKDGVAFIKNVYNKQKYRIEQSFYDKKYKAVNKRDGDFAIFRETKNNVGGILSQSYFNSDNNPTNLHNNGYHKLEFSYYSIENFEFEELSFYEKQGKLTVSEHNSYAKRIRKFDQHGNLIEERYVDKKGSLIEPYGNTFAMIKQEYDEDFNLTKISYFDHQEKLINHKADSTGYAIVTYSYDKNRHWYKKDIYNQKKKLIKENYKPKKGNLFGIHLFRLLKIQHSIVLIFGLILVVYLFFISRIKNLKGRNRALKFLIWFGLLHSIYGVGILRKDPGFEEQFLVFFGLNITFLIILLSAFINRKAAGIFYLLYGMIINITLLILFRNDYYYLRYWLVIYSFPGIFIAIFFIMNRSINKWKKIVIPFISIVLLLGILLYLMYPFKGNKWRSWDDGLIKNEDFIGIPKRNSNSTAVIRSKIFFEYVCEEGEFKVITTSKMSRFNSWKNELLSGYLLNHEQKHFDITRLYEQKLSERLNEIENPCGLEEDELDDKINLIKDEIFYALSRAQKEYDLETEHSQLTEQQMKWNEIISKEIKKVGVNF